MLATFAELLWVLFGDVCPLYGQIYKLWRVFNHLYIIPLMMIPRTTQEIKEEIRREEAEAESQGTRNQSEALQMKKQIQGANQEIGNSSNK